MNLQKQAFTLVELIVVITILAVLSTIGFVSYSGYLAGTRDTNRISQLKAISDGLHLFSTNHTLPNPDDPIDIKANGEVIAYQGYSGKNVLETITYSTPGLDPKDKTYFSYYLTRDKKYFQLMAFLEEEDNLQVSGIFNKTNAVDYSIRYPTVNGKKLGILTDELNVPVQEVSELKSAGEIDLGGTNSGTIYSAHINDGRTYTFTGRILNHKLYTISKPGKYGPPKDCPDGFIGVWGDSQFNQIGFCVAKYEMTYAEGHGFSGPNSVGENNGEYGLWNSYSFDDNYTKTLDPGDIGYGRKIASRSGDYTITDITGKEAVDACKTMGNGYHLIMNNEWMSLARQIEFEKENWSSGEVGNGFISIGITSSTLGCNDTLGGNIETYGEWGTKTGPGNNSCDDKRKLKLFNYQEIWDLAGNVWEWVNKANTLDGSGYNSGDTRFGTTNNWKEWTDVEIDSNERNNYGPIIGKDGTQGMGGIADLVGATENIFIRGGSAWNDGNPGIYSLDLSWDEWAIQNSTGFRCAYIK